MCDNRECVAFRKGKVWVNKGFGKFDMSREVYNSQCPKCHKNCAEVRNMGLYLANSTLRGRFKNEQRDKETKSSQTEKRSFLTFERSNESLTNWLYLEMEVTPLKTSWCEIY